MSFPTLVRYKKTRLYVLESDCSSGTVPCQSAPEARFAFIHKDTSRLPDTLPLDGTAGLGYYSFFLMPIDEMGSGNEAYIAITNLSGVSSNTIRLAWFGSRKSQVDDRLLATAAGIVRVKPLSTRFANTGLTFSQDASVSLTQAGFEVSAGSGTHRLGVGNDASDIEGPLFLPLGRADSGSILYTALVPEEVLQGLACGLRFFRKRASGNKYDVVHMNLVDFAGDKRKIPLTIQLRPVESPAKAVEDWESRAWFGLRDGTRVAVRSNFRTTMGARTEIVGLADASLRPHSSPKGSTDGDPPKYLVPHGAYAIRALKGDVHPGSTRHGLMCFQEGAEFLEACLTGATPDLIEFVAKCDAFVGVDAANKPTLTSAAKTAWIRLRPSNGEPVKYNSMAEKAVLYCHGDKKPQLNFETVALSEFTGGTMPAVPIAIPAGTRDLGSGIAKAHQLLVELESAAIHPIRRDKLVRGQIGPMGGQPIQHATPQGFIADVKAGRDWERLVLTKTVDSTVVTIEPPTPELTVELQNKDVFIVCQDDKALGNLKGTPGMSDWKFKLASSKGTSKPIVIFKYAPGTLKSLVEDPESWANPGIFLKGLNPQDVKNAIIEFLEEAKKRPDLKSFVDLYENDDNWRGLLVLGGSIDPSSLPPELRIVERLMKGIDFHHFGINLTSVKESSSGLDPDDGSLFGAIATSGPHNDLVTVTDLLVVFRNSTIQDFSCRLEINFPGFFDAPVSSGSKPATIQGRFERHGDQVTYSFSIEATTTIRVDSQILDSIVLERATLTAEVKEDKSLESRFTIQGSINFGTGLKFFSVKTIEFSDLDFGLTFNNKNDLTGLPFSAARIKLGLFSTFDKSFLRTFPLKLSGFAAFPAGVDLPALGFIPFKGVGKLTWGLRFQLDLGSFGSLVAAGSDFIVDVLLGWRHGFSDVLWGLKLPETSNGKTEIGIQGVLRILFKSLSTFEVPQGSGDPAFGLRMECAALQFLGKEFPKDDRPDLYIFAGKANPTEKMGWFTCFGDDPFVGIGQRVSLTVNGDGTEAAIKSLAGNANFPALVNRCSASTPGNQQADANAVVGRVAYNAEAKWLIGARFKVGGLLEAGFIFNDPVMYGMFVKLLDPVGLSFDISYRKVTESVGLYYIDLGLPEQLRTFEVGAAQIRVPNFALGIFTNGDWKGDAGFPVNMDYARSFRAEVFPFTGNGGLYLARLSGATSKQYFPDQVQEFQSVIAAGLALRVGIGKNIEKGILRAGASLTLYGTVEGALGFHTASPVAGNLTPAGIDLRGRMGIMGELYGTADFGILCARVSILIYAGMGMRIHKINGKAFGIRVWVEMGVVVRVDLIIRIRLFIKTIEIHIPLRFEMTLQFGYCIGDCSNLASLAGSARALTAAPSFLNWDTYPDPASTKPDVQLYFSAEPTVVGGKTNLVFSLYADDSLDTVISGLAEWLLLSFAGKDWRKHKFDTNDIDRLNSLLHVPETLALTSLVPGAEQATNLDYEQIARFLKNNYTFALNDLPNKDVTLYPFPMASGTELKQGSSIVQAFPKPGTELTIERQREINRELNTLNERLLREARGAKGKAKLKAIPRRPFQEVLFQDYFEIIVKGLFDQMFDVFYAGFNSSKQPTEFEMSGGDLFKGLTDDRVSSVRETAARLFRFGLRLRQDKSDLYDKPVFALTGQQQEVTGLTADQGYSLADSTGGNNWFKKSASLKVSATAVRTLEGTHLSVGLGDPTLKRVEGELVGRPYSLTNRTFASLASGVKVSLHPMSIDLVAAIDLKAPVDFRLKQAKSGIPFSQGAPVDLAGGRFVTTFSMVIRQVKDADGNAVPDLLQVVGTEEANRRVLEEILSSRPDLANYRLHLLFPKGAGLIEENLDPTALTLYQTNLSTDSRPFQAALRVEERIDSDRGTYVANATQTLAFLELLRRCSVVNSGGYFLRYPKKAGGLYSQFGDLDQPLRLTVLLSPESESLRAEKWHNAVLIVPADDAVGMDTYAVADVAKLSIVPILQNAGCVGFQVSRTEPSGTDDEKLLASVYSLLQYTLSGKDLDPDLVKLATLPIPPKTEGHPIASDPHTGRSGQQVPKGSWLYEETVALYRLAKGQSASDPDPYALIGKEVKFAFKLRDVYGNELDMSANPVKEIDHKPLYIDPLVSPTAWPMTQWGYELHPNDGMRLSAMFVPDEFGVIAGETNPQAKWLERAKQPSFLEKVQITLRTYRNVRHQVRQGDVTANVDSDLTGTVALDLSPFVSLAESVIKWLEDLEKLSKRAIAGETVTGPASRPLIATVLVKLLAKPRGDKPFAMLDVRLTLNRDDALVAPLSPENRASVKQTQAEIRPLRGNDPKNSTLANLDKMLQDCYKGALTLGLGTEKTGETVPFYVQDRALNVKFFTGAQTPDNTRFYCPKPVLQGLWSGVVPHKDQLVKFVDLDLEIPLESFFAAFEDLLKPDNSRLIAESDPDSLNTLIGLKAEVARLYAERLQPLFAGKAHSGLKAAQREFRQRLRTDLRNGSIPDTFVQLDTGVCTAPEAGYQAPRLFGQIRLEDKTNSGVTSNYACSAAKVPLAKSSEATIINFDVGAKTPEPPSHEKMTFDFRVTHVEHKIEEFQGGDDNYVASSWIQLLAPKSVPIPPMKVPFPLRRYPKAPIIDSVKAVASKMSAGVPAGRALRDGRQWDLEYSIKSFNSDQDSLAHVITYNLPVRALALKADSASLPEAIALFGYAYETESNIVCDSPLKSRIVKFAKDSQAERDKTVAAMSMLARGIVEAMPTERVAALTAEAGVVNEFEMSFEDSGKTVIYALTKGVPLHSKGVTIKRETDQETGTKPEMVMLKMQTTALNKLVTWELKLPEIDALAAETVQPSVSVFRNFNLMGDASWKTAEGFSYKTPEVKFGEIVRVSVDRLDDIDLAGLLTGGPKKLEDYLQKLFDVLLLRDRPNYKFQAEVSLEYSVHQDPSVSSVAVVPLQFVSVSDATSEEVGDWATALEEYLRSKMPRSGSLVIDLMVFGCFSQGRTLPLLRFRRLAIPLASLQTLSVPSGFAVRYLV